MPKGYKQLTRDERIQIQTLKDRGDGPSVIAKQLGHGKGTISSEIKRNSDLKTKHRKKPQVKRKIDDPLLIALVREKLFQKWSPEQISGYSKAKGIANIGKTTIYKMIEIDRLNGGTLYLNLRHMGKSYIKRAGRDAGRGLIRNRVDIELRPQIVDEKSRVGDIEGDLIVGAEQSGYIVSLVDRRSKFTYLVLLKNKTAREVTDAIIAVLTPVKNSLFTITTDNGKEFAGHEEVSTALGVSFYFARPYHSWERGLNEHTNGLVRQYLPKGMRFDQLTQADVRQVADALNHRPRKSLGFETPFAVFNRAVLTGSCKNRRFKRLCGTKATHLIPFLKGNMNTLQAQINIR
jgi:IS30 family transposase